MNKKTLTALQGSIKKWEAIVAGTGEDDGNRNCPLCKLFWEKTYNCEGCPVSERTGLGSCEGSPYDEWADQVNEWPCSATTPRLVALAKAELDFLRGLLPK